MLVLFCKGGFRCARFFMMVFEDVILGGMCCNRLDPYYSAVLHGIKTNNKELQWHIIDQHKWSRYVDQLEMANGQQLYCTLYIRDYWLGIKLTSPSLL